MKHWSEKARAHNDVAKVWCRDVSWDIVKHLGKLIDLAKVREYCRSYVGPRGLRALSRPCKPWNRWEQRQSRRGIL